MAMYEVGNFKFDTKTKARVFEADIRNRHKPATKAPHDVVLLSGSDLEFVGSLLLLHPDLDDKVKNGIVGIAVRWSTIKYTDLQYVIVDDNGDLTTFSINTCFYGKGTSLDLLFRKALRFEVADQIKAFRDSKVSGGMVKCAISKKIIPEQQAVVDHFPPFEDIVLTFLNGQTITQSMIAYDKNNFPILADDKMRREWREIHQITVDMGGIRMCDKTLNASAGRWKI